MVEGGKGFIKIRKKKHAKEKKTFKERERKKKGFFTFNKIKELFFADQKESPLAFLKKRKMHKKDDSVILLQDIFEIYFP